MLMSQEARIMQDLIQTAKNDDLIKGITDGLEDFIDGRCKHFKNDEELEAYLMSL
jgi:hypothetical protein